jgi:hypothetical protein
LEALNVSLEYILCSCIQCREWEAWIAWMVVVRVFIASTTILVVVWILYRWAHRTVRWCNGHSTVHCPVSATSADRWGLELLTVEVVCPLGAPDNSVCNGHSTVHCPVSATSADRWGLELLTVVVVCPLCAPDNSVVQRTLHCSLSGECHISRPLGFGAVDRWSRLSFGCTGQSGSTPDSSCDLTSQTVSDLLTLQTTAQLIAVDRWQSRSLLRGLAGQSGDTPDNPVI